MKIRADFVTNSSSSSYITFTFVMKDGTEIMSDDIPVLEYYGENYYRYSQEELLQKFQNMQTLDELLDFIGKKQHRRGHCPSGEKRFSPRDQRRDFSAP